MCSRFEGHRLYACVCVSEPACMHKTSNLSWITNCQLRRSVSTIPCFYLTAHCILGVVVCLRGPVCVAACGLHQWDWCSSLNWTSFISVAEPFLSSIGPPGPLNCWHWPPLSPPLLSPSSKLQHAAKIVRCVSSAYWSAWPKEVGPQHFTEYIM